MRKKSNTCPPNKDILEDLYINEKSTMHQIAKKLGYGYGTIHKYLKLYGIKIRTLSEAKSGLKKSDEHKRKLSEGKKGKNNPNYGKKSKHHGKRYWVKCPNGEVVSMRSTWEAAYANWLNEQNIIWQYEPETFILEDGSAYTPDFFLEESNEWIEVKGWLTREHQKKMTSFKKMHPNKKLILADGKYLIAIGVDLKKIYVTSRPQIKCAFCNKLFYRKDPNQHLCSITCRNKYISRKGKANIERKITKPKRKYRGCQKGEKNNGAKLNSNTVIEIRTLRSEGKTYKEISEIVAASSTTIRSVVKGISWSHI